MAAATHMVGSAHSASSSSISPRPPWHPVVVLVPNHQHQALYDPDLVTPPPITPATASPARHNHGEQHLRPASRRRAGKQRRPRPSRKLPTTYISADAASFRRMVHQVTGADEGVVHQAFPTEEQQLLCRPAPAPSSRAALTTTTLLPTLDTSAFLIGSGRVTPLARPGSAGCHGPAVAVGDPGAALQAEEACRSGGVRGGGGEYSCSNSIAGGGGFPSLESWNDADAIFQE